MHQGGEFAGDARVAEVGQPAPPSVSGTAAAEYASTGTPAAMASTSGTQKPSCSLSEM